MNQPEIPVDQLSALLSLLSSERVATLAVLEHGVPITALVGYAWDAAGGGVLIHLSSLSAHQRALLSHPECSLLVHEQDDGRGQPLMLKRASVRGQARVIERESDDFATAAELYLAKLPASRMMFSLGDFDLIRIHLSEIRFVAGFGQAFTVSGEMLRGQF